MQFCYCTAWAYSSLEDSPSCTKLGYRKTNPPVRIEYPEYEMDLAAYEKNFNEINEINSLPIGKIASKKKRNYLALQYAFGESLGRKGFVDFLDCVSIE